MRVLLDAKELTAQGTGTARYEREIATRISRMYPTVTIVRRRSRRDGSAAALSGGLITVPDRVPALFVEQIIVPLASLFCRAHVVHALAGRIPIVPLPARRVITFHEDRSAYYRDHPPTTRYERMARPWHVWSEVRSLRQADHVIAISGTSAAAAQELTGAEMSVGVIHHGVSSVFHPRSDHLERPPYVLMFDSGDLRDDLDFAFDVLELISKHVRLVLVGADHPGREVLKRRALERGLDVVFTGLVTDEELATLYSGAVCYLHASSFEGFGLGVIEAMACGTVVVARPSASLREVAAGACIESPTAEDASRAILELLQDKELRDRLRARGLERAASFSWDMAASKTAEVYA